MANHMSYMHGSFPTSKSNEHGSHLNNEHSTTHEDPMLRDRTEAHSVPAGQAPSFMSGHGNR